jgi:transmembrane sensor
MARETANEIDAVAAQWAARLDRGPLSAEDDQAFHAWLAHDPRRPGAYARVRAVAIHTARAKALGAHFNPSDFNQASPQGWSRRGALLAAGGLAASATAVTVGIGFLAAPRRIDTRKGEIKVAPLADGSVVTLNTASSLLVSFSSHRRNVTLLAGEALFDVAKDKFRTFIVTAGDTKIRAVGTSFTVRHLANRPVQVLVREGVVEVSKLDPKTATPLRAGLNTEVTAPLSHAQPVAARLAAPELDRLLAWREGRLAFEGQTLSQAAAEFGRYSDTKIIIDDPALGREEIAGLYQANDPVGFSKAVAAILNAHTEVGEGVVRITR